MKHLLLIRHAKSSWKNPELKDHDRPLNNRGKRNAPEMALRLLSANIKADFVLSSSSRRTVDTANLICAEYPVEIKKSMNLFHCSASELIQEIRNTASRINSLFVLGHEPGISATVFKLTGVSIAHFPTCGIASIIFNEDHWKNIDTKKGELEWFDYPKNSNSPFI